MTLRWLLMLAVTLGVASCSSGADRESADNSGTILDAEVVPATTVEAAEGDSVEPEPGDLPEGYELESQGTINRVVPSGSTTIRTVVAVGPSPSDPRFIEYTLFDLSDAADASTATELAGLAEDSAVVDFESGAFAFVSAETQPRFDLQLLSYGPSANATFRAVVEEGVIAIGGSASLQPAAIEDMLNALSADDAQGPPVLPQKMSVLVDDVLPAGRSVDLTSVHGTTSVVVYDGVGREWFDYFTWGDPEISPPAELTDLVADVSLQPPTNYGPNGATWDPVRISLWADDRLMIIEQPDTVPPGDTRAVASLVLDEPAFDVLVAKAPESDSGTAPDSGAAPARSDPDRASSEPPSQEDLAAFQQFVESRRGIELGQPIVFDYVPDFPTEGITFDFISSELWLVATTLGLTGDGRTHEEANQSRIDAIRGTPGVIALQPTKTETDVVTVHEMVHVLDPAPAEVASAEPFSMAQVISEGNAHRIAYDYLLTLDAEEQAIMEPFPHIFPKGGDPRISPAVQDLLEFAYDEGRLFMAAAAEDGGETRVGEVFQRPPASTEQIMFFDAWVRDDRPTVVPVPASPSGTTPLDEGSLGVYLLLLVATEADSEDEALVSLREWSGDSFALYEAGAEICLTATIAFDSSEAAEGFGTILQAATASDDGEAVEIESRTVRATLCA